MKRNTELVSVSKNIDIGLNEGNALLVVITGTTFVGTVDFQHSANGINYANTPYITARSVTAAKTVAQLSNPGSATEYIVLPPLTQARIAITVTSGTVTVTHREISYAAPFDGAFATGASLKLGAATFEWEDADANANELILDLPAGGAVNVPVLVVGIGIKDVDLGLFNGLTQPLVATLDADRDSYVGLTYTSDDVAVLKMRLSSGTVRNHIVPDVASDTFVMLAATQTLTSKALTSPTVTGVPTAAGATWTDLGIVTTMIVDDIGLKVRNPAETFNYIITAGAISADRILNLPVITSTDTIVVVALAQTLTNKTLTAPFVTDLQYNPSSEADLSSTFGRQLVGTTGVIWIPPGDMFFKSGSTGSAGDRIQFHDDGGMISFHNGVAIGAGNYSIGRDSDATQQLHFNVPTASTMEWSINDIAKIVLSTGKIELQSIQLGWGGGLAPEAGQYVITRNTDTPNRLQFNVPTGVSFEWSVNDVAELVLSDSQLDLQDNALLAGATTVTTLSMNNLITWSAGAAITAANYQVGRDADATNQLHFNVPTGATFEFSINDASILVLSPNILTLTGTSRVTTSSGNLRIGGTGGNASVTLFTGTAPDSGMEVNVNQVGVIGSLRGVNSNGFLDLHGDTSSGLSVRILDTGNVKIAGTATRATTEGTNHLDIFDGTAPVGTLANGISLYSTAGELRVMDSGGTATLLSPHGANNEWIYYSKNTETGQVLLISMERLLKDVNRKLGLNHVKEWTDSDPQDYMSAKELHRYMVSDQPALDTPRPWWVRLWQRICRR